MSIKQQGARQRIIDAAIKLFATNGYKATTTREIVKLAGSSLSMLDLHFSSKEDLYKVVIDCVIEVYVKNTLNLFGEIVDQRSKGKIDKLTSWQYIEQIVDTHLNIVMKPENKELILILNRALQEEEIIYQVEPAFMYMYNLQLLFEDYVGCEHGQWWARTLSFQVITSLLSLLTYPRVITPFNDIDNFLIPAPLDTKEIVEQLKENTLCTIKANLENKTK